ncbi:hypothetical protein [Neobacillus soli]|nr:hypothetical protein [Neobacillus soli]
MTYSKLSGAIVQQVAVTFLVPLTGRLVKKGFGKFAIELKKQAT